MKFGKRFLAALAEKPHTLVYAIDYNKLKKQLKQRPSAASSTNNLTGLELRDADAAPAEPASPRAGWDEALFSEIERADSSFSARELQLLAKLHALLEVHGADGLGCDEAAPFLDEVAALRMHATLNVIACSKITKKRDKLCSYRNTRVRRRPPLRPRMLERLRRARFARSLDSSLLFERCRMHLPVTLSDELLAINVRAVLFEQIHHFPAYSSGYGHPGYSSGDEPPLVIDLPPSPQARAAEPRDDAPRPPAPDAPAAAITSTDVGAELKVEIVAAPPDPAPGQPSSAGRHPWRRFPRAYSSKSMTDLLSSPRVSSRGELSAMTALNRAQSFLSNERTLLAWVRTTTAMFGLALALLNSSVGEGAVSWASAVALACCVAAIASYVLGCQRYRELKDALQQSEFVLLRTSRLKPYIICVLVVFVATLAVCIQQLILVYEEARLREL